jgi:hypothetical protein
MKRSEALALIKQRGYHDDAQGAAIIRAQKRIGTAAARKAFIDGGKAKKRGEQCDCPACITERGGPGKEK